jgi:uncharacterized membrane-anchored protein
MTHSNNHPTKVPEVTLGFWIIKILATTLGETGGDAVTMTWLKADVMVNQEYLIGSAILQGRPWQTLRPVLWGLVTQAVHCSCSSASWQC